jgi:radical SAM superfamily enzyme YgiQ (UPF0313 family)
MSKDAVILSVPPILLLGPHLAPALLKSYVKQHKFDVFCYDPSYHFFSQLPEDQKSNWPYNNFPKDISQEVLNKNFEQWLEVITEHKPKVLGLSTHAWASLFFLEGFCKFLQTKETTFKIILGGPLSMEVGEHFKKEGLIHHFVVGEGEEAFLSILNNKYDHPNIDGETPVPLSSKEFNAIPYPDFSDYDFNINKDLHKNANRIYLAGSRGCAYNCSFCNVPSMTIQYRRKDPHAFATEIQFFQKKYTPSFIELCDSITNVSHQYFNELCKELINLQDEEQERLKLVCFYRVKKASQTSEETFKLASEAGIYRLKIGVESGSQSVREHIGKKETNDDIMHTIKYCHQYNIKINLLLIVGYISETKEDFELTIKLLEDIKSAGYFSAIEAVVINELYISKNTPLEKMIETEATFNYESNSSDDQNWNITLKNGELINRDVRDHRVEVLKQYVKDNFYKTKNLLSFSNSSQSSEQLLQK